MVVFELEIVERVDGKLLVVNLVVVELIVVGRAVNVVFFTGLAILNSLVKSTFVPFFSISAYPDELVQLWAFFSVCRSIHNPRVFLLTWNWLS
jgi:hypothetical protein